MGKDLKTRKGMARIICSIFFLVLGFTILVFMAVLESKGISVEGILLAAPIGGTLLCFLISLIFAVASYPHLAESETEKIYKFYAERELEKIPLMNKERVQKRLYELKFKPIEEGLYRKWCFVFSLWKDHICYYVRMIDDFEVENAVPREVERFTSMRKKGSNVCFLILIYMDKIGEKDKADAKEYSKNSIAREVVLKSQATVLTVVIDKSTYTAYFLDIGKGKKAPYIPMAVDCLRKCACIPVQGCFMKNN